MDLRPSGYEPDERARRLLLPKPYACTLPVVASLTRSPLGLATRSIAMVKSIAEMMPSPNSSSISAFHAGPLTITSSNRRYGRSSTAASTLVAPCSPRGRFREQSEIRSGYKLEILDWFHGGPERSRTSDLRFRNPTVCPDAPKKSRTDDFLSVNETTNCLGDSMSSAQLLKLVFRDADAE